MNTRDRTSPTRLVAVLFVLTLVLVVVPGVGAAPLALTDAGSWNLGTFRKAQLTGGAGTNFTPTLTSATNQVRLTIKNTTMAGWNITVRKVDALWNPVMRVYLKRTGAELEQARSRVGFPTRKSPVPTRPSSRERKTGAAFRCDSS